MIHRIRLACLGGTALEFFEFQIFVMLMPFLLVHFFPPSTQAERSWLAAYRVFGVAFLARPVGSVLLGLVGDYYGRRRALLMAMWLMAIATLLMGLSPGWAVVGSAATLMLVFCRILQGLSLGGEYACGFVFLYEHLRNPRCRDLIWTDMGGCIGSALAALVAALTTQFFSAESMQAFGWRIPLLAGVLLAVCGIYIRASLTDPDSHSTLLSRNRQRTWRQYYREVLGVAPTLLLASLACAPNGIFWYLLLVFVPHQVLPLGVSMLMLFSLINLGSLWPGAYLADRFGGFRIWIISVIALTGNFVFILSSHQPVLQTAAWCLEAMLLAINMGPRIFILSRCFPLAIRATGCSFTYSVANVFGGVTPFVALSLYHQFHDFSALMLGLGVMCVLSVISMGLLALQRQDTRAFHFIQHEEM